MNFDTNVRYIHGVGEKRAALFAKLGITDVQSLLYHFPRSYQDRRARALGDIADGENAACIMTVATDPQTTMIRRGMVLTKFRAFDGIFNCHITFFNQSYVKDVFKKGTVFRFYGKFKKTGMGYSLTSPLYEPVIPGTEEKLRDFCAVYRLCEGLTQNIVRRSVAEAMKGMADARSDTDTDPIPADVRKAYGFGNLYDSLCQIHDPSDEGELLRSRRRFVFEELFLFSVAVSVSKQQRVRCPALSMKDVDMQPFFDVLPFSFTAAQRRVFSEIYQDMVHSSHPMNRLLSGDVGSGKTAPAAAAAYVALRNGYSVAFMAPTEILSRQHYNDLAPLFETLGYRCELLIGATTASKKKKIKSELADGTLRFVIGTHALITDDVVIHNLGLVITDEQHRFGVTQRSALSHKALQRNTLVMSATPIPRTLALSMFGEVDLSVIDELPPGRKKVDTFAVDERYRERLYAFIRKQVSEGHQVYIVCPAIEEQKDEEDWSAPEENSDLPFCFRESAPRKAAVDYAAELQNEVFPDLCIGFLHGKMKSREKEAVMQDFCDGKISVLVSTTVIEVGVNVPNATLMIVENAELFGLSQLHQLRGRVGRGPYQSYCVLMSDSKTEEAKKRLSVMCRLSNGFEIAEEDLKLRGPGDFFQSQAADTFRQHGSLNFKIADMAQDMELMQNAFLSASNVLKKDSSLIMPEHAAIRNRIRNMGILT